MSLRRSKVAAPSDPGGGNRPASPIGPAKLGAVHPETSPTGPRSRDAGASKVDRKMGEYLPPVVLGGVTALVEDALACPGLGELQVQSKVGGDCPECVSKVQAVVQGWN